MGGDNKVVVAVSVQISKLTEVKIKVRSIFYSLYCFRADVHHFRLLLLLLLFYCLNKQMLIYYNFQTSVSDMKTCFLEVTGTDYYLRGCLLVSKTNSPWPLPRTYYTVCPLHTAPPVEAVRWCWWCWGDAPPQPAWTRHPVASPCPPHLWGNSSSRSVIQSRQWSHYYHSHCN